jgi:UV DNA damage endonuclease
MFPFASHELYGYSLDYCAPILAEVGALANKYGHRLTVHPGQYTQLGSPRDSVIKASIRELEYHAQMLNLMGIGPDGVMIIHGGGVYGDKEAALARIRKTVEEDLPQDVRDRLVLENDEVSLTSLRMMLYLLIPSMPRSFVIMLQIYCRYAKIWISHSSSTIITTRSILLLISLPQRLLHVPTLFSPGAASNLSST